MPQVQKDSHFENRSYKIVTPKSTRYFLSFDKVSSAVLGQPREIVRIIGTFLEQKDLANAILVNKAWHRGFSQNSLWVPFVPPFLRHQSRYPVRVAAAYNYYCNKCWIEGEYSIEESKFPSPHSKFFISKALIAPDSSRALTMGTGGRVSLWRDLGTKNCRGELIAGIDQSRNPHQSNHITGGMISPRSNCVFTCDMQGGIVRWKGFETNQVTATVIAGLDSSENPHFSLNIGGGAISAEGWGITFGGKGTLVMWDDLESDSPQHQLIGGGLYNPHSSNMITAGDLSPDGSWALTVAVFDSVVFWRGLRTGTIIPTKVRHKLTKGNINNCTISSDGQWALTMGELGFVVKWKDLEEDSPVPTLLVGKPKLQENPHKSDWVKKFAHSSDGSWTITFGNESVVSWTNLGSEKPKWKIIADRKGKVPMEILISPRNQWAMVFTSRSETIEIWRPKIELFEKKLKTQFPSKQSCDFYNIDCTLF